MRSWMIRALNGVLDGHHSPYGWIEVGEFAGRLRCYPFNDE